MTKMKNTKKGMAKKALSISLVAAMLATSNVPVWAAFEADDATPIVVEDDGFVTEAPVEENTVPTEETVAEETAPVYAATEEVNANNYVEENIKVEAGAWGTAIAPSGTIKDAQGQVVENLTYTWLINGTEAFGNNTTQEEDGNLSAVTYTPVLADYNKSLSLQITKKEGNTVVYNKIISAGVVKAKDISSSIDNVLTFNTVTYDGKVKYEAPINAYNVSVDSSTTITNNDITWHYEQKDNDFVNATAVDSNGVAIEADKISVYGTVEGVYGYTGTTATGTYAIDQKVMTASDIELTMKNTSFEYTGSPISLNKGDVVVMAVSNDGNTKVDITNALKSGNNIVTGTDLYDQGNIGKNYFADIDLVTAFDNTDDAKALYANYKIPTSTVFVTSKNTYQVVARNLQNCTAVITKDYELDTFKANPTINYSDIKITGADGKSFTVGNISGLNVTIEKVAIDAANADRTGTIANAITISAAADSTNFSNSVKASLVLTTSSLSSATVTATKPIARTLDSSKPSVGNATLKVPYTGKAYDLKADYGLTVTVNGTALKSGEYTVEYDDNVNAGIVKATIKGAGSYAGSQKVVYFEIEKATISDLEVEKTSASALSINPANNADASLYKEEIALSIKIDLDGDSVKETLVEGKDYTVKYFYGATANSTTADGNNVDGNYVIAKITLAKDGNFTGTLANVALPIGKKSIKDVQITVSPETYTYTGKSITPTLVVTDGSYELEKDVDYKVTVKNATNVGTATVTITALATSRDYQAGTTASKTFEIKAANAEDVKVVLSLNNNTATSFDYTGKQIRPVVSDVMLNGVSVKDDFSIAYPVYGENKDAGKEMGTVTITPKTSNFIGTKTQTFDIKGEVLTGTLRVYDKDSKVFALGSTQYLDTVGYQYLRKNNNDYYERYNGSAHTFTTTFTATDLSKNLVEGTDYEIQYVENVDVGTAYLFAVAKGNYEGTVTATFYEGDNAKQVTVKNIIAGTIRAFDITGSQIFAEDVTVENGIYAGGLLVKPQVTVVVSGTTLTEGVDYRLSTWPINNNGTVGVDVTNGKPYYVDIIPMGGYSAGDDLSYNKWGIDPFNLKNADIVVKDGTVISVKNGNIPVDTADYDVTDNGDGTLTVSAKDDSKNYTGSITVDKIGDVLSVPTITASVDRNMVDVALTEAIDGATAYDYVLCKSAADLEEETYFKSKMSADATTTQFQFVREGQYYVYARAAKRDENGKKIVSNWSEAAVINVTCDTPNAPTVAKVTTKGNTVTVTYTTGARTEGVDVIIGGAVRKQLEDDAMRPVNYNSKTGLIKNVPATTKTVTFTNVAKGTYFVGVHPYITSNDGLKYFGRWSKQTGITKVVVG